MFKPSLAKGELGGEGVACATPHPPDRKTIPIPAFPLKGKERLP